MFFNSFNEEVREIFKQDKDKYLVLSWIIFNTNYQEEYNGLGMYECYFSFSVIEEVCNMTHRKALKIIKELVEEKHIEWVKKGRSKQDKSILKLTLERTSKRTSEQTSQRTSKRTSKSIDIQGIDKDSEPVGVPVNEPVEVPVSVPLSKNLSKNQSKNNIYRLLPQTPHVKLREEELENLIQEFGKELVEQTILGLENYIVNGKGSRYKDHNLVIKTWITRNLNKENQTRTSNTHSKQIQIDSKPKLSGHDKFTSIHQHNWNMGDLEKAQELLLARKRGEITESQYKEAIGKIAFG